MLSFGFDFMGRYQNGACRSGRSFCLFPRSYPCCRRSNCVPGPTFVFGANGVGARWSVRLAGVDEGPQPTAGGVSQGNLFRTFACPLLFSLSHFRAAATCRISHGIQRPTRRLPKLRSSVHIKPRLSLQNQPAEHIAVLPDSMAPSPGELFRILIHAVTRVT